MKDATFTMRRLFKQLEIYNENGVGVDIYLNSVDMDQVDVCDTTDMDPQEFIHMNQGQLVIYSRQ